MIAVKNTVIPLKAAERLIQLPYAARDSLSEIRLRAGRRAAAVTADGRSYPCSERLTAADINDCFQELCRYSVHSFSREIAEGYITLPGGHRAGFCGTAVMKDGRLETLRDISSIDLRLAREVHGCAAELHRAAFSGGAVSLLLCGRPMSGKTTLLRDLARILGTSRRVALIDSRSELAAANGGAPMLDVGENTDVLSGYPKREGIMTALRVLSPEYIICDEIGGDADAVAECMHCGVKLIATAHGGSMDELRRRPDTAGLLPMFDAAAVIAEKGRLLDLRFSGGNGI